MLCRSGVRENKDGSKYTETISGAVRGRDVVIFHSRCTPDLGEKLAWVVCAQRVNLARRRRERERLLSGTLPWDERARG